LVGGFEADAVDFAGGAVGVFAKNLFGLAAEAVDELQAAGGAYAVGLQEDVQLALGAFVVPSLFDGGGAFFADAGDVAETGGFFAEDPEGIGPKGIYDFVGVNLSDAGDEAAAEVFANAVDGGGELAFEVGNPKLRAVLGVVGPFAA